MKQMTYEEMKDKLLLIVNGDYRSGTPKRMDVYTDYLYGYGYNGTDVKDRDNYIAVSWLVRGEGGGNCWGDSPTPLGSERPVDLEPLLTMFLEDEVPEVSFLQYTKLKRECFEEYERSEHEYYGNWSEYDGIALNIQKLYDSLVEMRYISND